MVVDEFALEWLKQGDKLASYGELAYTSKAVHVDDRERHCGGFIKELCFQDRRILVPNSLQSEGRNDEAGAP
jgi:hypothetical protein